MDMPRKPATNASAAVDVILVVVSVVGEEAKWVADLLMLCGVVYGWEVRGWMEGSVLANLLVTTLGSLREFVLPTFSSVLLQSGHPQPTTPTFRSSWGMAAVQRVVQSPC